MAKYALSLRLIVLVICVSTILGDAIPESESGPNPAPSASAAPAPAPIAYDLSGIINAVLKILYAILRGENFGLPRLLG